MAHNVTKTLITKLPMDVSLLSDVQIEAIKALYQVSFAPTFPDVNFELLIDDEEERSLDLYQHIQKEFKVAELTTPLPTLPTTAQKPTTQTQKKPSNPFAGLSKLFGELGELLEDGEESQ